MTAWLYTVERDGILIGLFTSRRRADGIAKATAPCTVYRIPANVALTSGRKVTETRGACRHWHYDRRAKRPDGPGWSPDLRKFTWIVPRRVKRQER